MVLHQNDALIVDDSLLCGLRPMTQKVYRRSLEGLVSYAQLRGTFPRTYHELDAVIVAYMKEAQLGPAYGERVLAAVEKVMPYSRGQLAWAHCHLDAVRKRAPPQHTVPTALHAVAAVAWSMALSGHARAGALCLLNWVFGLRPIEGIHLTREQIVPVGKKVPGHPARMSTVLLEPRRGTKVNRAQFSIAFDFLAGLADTLCRRFYDSTPPGASITVLTSTTELARMMAKACQVLRLDLTYTPHAMRAGWATHCRILGSPFGEIQERGRWESPKTLRGYLDVASVLALQSAEPSVEHIGNWLLEDLENRFPWWNA